MQYVIQKLIQSQLFGSLLGIFLTAFLTYTVTRWSDRRKKNLDVLTFQLKHIFTPLYTMVNGKRTEEIDKSRLYRSLDLKRKKYLIYFPDEFLDIIRKMDREADEISDRTVYICKEYIEYRYLSLKKQLGYTGRGWNILRKNYFKSYTALKLTLLLSVSLQLLCLGAVLIDDGFLYHEYPKAYAFVTNAFAVLAVINLFIVLVYIIFVLFHISSLYENKPNQDKSADNTSNRAKML